MFTPIFSIANPLPRFQSNLDRFNADATQRAMKLRQSLCYRYRSTHLKPSRYTKTQGSAGGDHNQPLSIITEKNNNYKAHPNIKHPLKHPYDRK